MAESNNTGHPIATGLVAGGATKIITGNRKRKYEAKAAAAPNKASKASWSGKAKVAKHLNKKRYAVGVGLAAAGANVYLHNKLTRPAVAPPMEQSVKDTRRLQNG